MNFLLVLTSILVLIVLPTVLVLGWHVRRYGLSPFILLVALGYSTLVLTMIVFSFERIAFP